MSVRLLYDITPTQRQDRVMGLFQSVGDGGGRRGRRGRVTAMIDGANKSQRMMGDQLRGMCKSVVGVGVSVMK